MLSRNSWSIRAGCSRTRRRWCASSSRRDGALSGVGEFWQAIDVNMSVAGSYAYNFRNPNERYSFREHPGAGLNPAIAGSSTRSTRITTASRSTRCGSTSGRRPPTRAARASTPRSSTARRPRSWARPARRTHAPCAQRGRRGSTRRATTTCTRRSCSTSRPWARASTFTFGKFATPIGAEVADASKNWAVTRGNLYNLLQPIDHLGLMTSTDIGPVTIGARRREPDQPDDELPGRELREELSRADRVRAGRHVQHGDHGGVRRRGLGGTVRRRRRTTQRTGLVDVLANFNSDAFSAYVERGLRVGRRARAAAWGVSVAGMVPITEMLSAALRLEYLRDKHNNSWTPRASSRSSGPVQPQRDLRRDRYARVRVRREPHAQDRGSLGPRRTRTVRVARTSSSRHTAAAAPRTRSSAWPRSSTRSSSNQLRI